MSLLAWQDGLAIRLAFGLEVTDGTSTRFLRLLTLDPGGVEIDGGTLAADLELSTLAVSIEPEALSLDVAASATCVDPADHTVAVSVAGPALAVLPGPSGLDAQLEDDGATNAGAGGSLAVDDLGGPNDVDP